MIIYESEFEWVKKRTIMALNEIGMLKSVTDEQIDDLATECYRTIFKYDCDAYWTFNPKEGFMECMAEVGLKAKEPNYKKGESAMSYEELMKTAEKILSDYDQAKDNLFIRVQNASNMPDDRVVTPMEDLAITYHVLIARSEDNDETTIQSSPVTPERLEQWGVSKEQLHEDALKSSPVVAPVRISALNEELGLPPTPDDPGILVVTNTHKKHGASAVFYPGVIDELAKNLDGDFYIIPSSIHEVLVFPDEIKDVLGINDMIQEVNASQVAPEEQLADHAYHYDAENKVFEIAKTDVPARSKSR